MRDTIELAREAGFPMAWISDNDGGVIRWKDIKAFEALVRADEQEKYKWDIHSCGPTCKRYACVAMREAVEAEREACAEVCDEYSATGKIEEFDRGWLACAKNTAAAIRNRGNT
jgi:hypothetical protein